MRIMAMFNVLYTNSCVLFSTQMRFLLIPHNMAIVSDRAFCSPNPCEHGGTCVETLQGYKCVCQDGYKGDSCKGKRKNLDHSR